MDLLKDELGSSIKTCVTSAVDGNTVASIEADRTSHVTEEEDQEITTIPAIKTEPNECFEFVVSVTPISYRLYPELLPTIALCPCETILTLVNGF
jgi:uncharacterized cupredoxin-like copper-binding protein